MKWENQWDDSKGYYTVEAQRGVLGIRWWKEVYDKRFSSTDEAGRWIEDEIKKADFNNGWKGTTVCEITSYPSKEIEVMYKNKPTIPPPKRP